MKLLSYTDVALRVLLYVGAHPDAPVGAATIASAYGISVDHVAKAAKALTREGLLRGTRGARGGVQLARPAEKIGVGAVVRLFEEERRPAECMSRDGGHCRIQRACRLRGVFQRAEAAFYRELDAHTLADLLDNGPTLVPLLRLPAAAGRGRR